MLDELILPNEVLRERYKKYGLCDECGTNNTIHATLHDGANLAIPDISRKTSTNRLVVIKKLIHYTRYSIKCNFLRKSIRMDTLRKV